MRKSWLWENAVTLATVLTAPTAVVALIYAHLQIVENREPNARQMPTSLARNVAARVRQPKALRSVPEACRFRL